VDECRAGPDNCDGSPDACVNTAGGFECQCPSGYTGNGRGDSGCRDVDECQSDTDNCDDSPDACRNTTGSFECQCPSGYTGDGRGASGCVNVDECKSGANDCFPGACVDQSPGYSCQCPAGYTGSGRGANGCTDVDECSMSRGGCDAHRPCLNDTPGFHCGPCEAGWGATDAKTCQQCTCYQTGGDRACSGGRDSLPTASELAGSAAIPAATLFGFQITLPNNAHVVSFGARKKSGDAVLFQMGLFTDGGGAPATRVASTSSTTFAGTSLDLAANNESTVCLPGGSYWLVGLANGDMTLGSAGSGRSVAVSGVSQLPTTWPGNGGGGNGQVNLFVVIDRP
jgi:hypothetical protein